MAKGGLFAGGGGRVRMQLDCTGRGQSTCEGTGLMGPGEGGRLCTWTPGRVMPQGRLSGTWISLNSTWSSSLTFLCCFLVWIG